MDRSDGGLSDEKEFIFFFGHLTSLRTLSLANSRIDFVSDSLFKPFVSLTKLILRGNSIFFILEGIFDVLQHLTYLDLSGNKIAVISEQTFGSGNKIAVISEQTFGVELRQQLTSLDLSDNPLTCSCELMWFRQWYVSHRGLFNATEPLYYCRDKQLKVTLDKFYKSQQACLLSPEISGVIIFVNAVIITSLTAFLLLYSYRWHLRLVLYEAFRGRDDVRRRYLQQGHFEYDVFVSYASENLRWVRQNLMAELEGNMGLRLCIHEREFIPGKNIVDNISDCVQRSKKIIMVFSRHFKRSQWCQFELAYCLNHVMDYDDALIIVSLDDMTSYELTSTMMAVLKTTTYIQWDRHPDAVRSFWGRLKQALHEIIPHAERFV
jgi:toll-like receptor 13